MHLIFKMPSLYLFTSAHRNEQQKKIRKRTFNGKSPLCCSDVSAWY